MLVAPALGSQSEAEQGLPTAKSRLRVCNSIVIIDSTDSPAINCRFVWNVVDCLNMADFKMVWSDGSLAGERILKLSGPFTLSTVFDFQDAMRANHPPITIVDLTDVPYMDSAALGSLMGLHVSCQQHERRYALVGPSDRLRTVFRVSGVANILVIYDSLAEADAALGGKAASA